MRFRRSRLAGAVLSLGVLVAGVGLAGCSDDSSAADSSGPNAAASGGATVQLADGVSCKSDNAKPTEMSFPAAPPTSAVAGKTSTATVQTSCGPIVIELYGDKAPQTVASFEFLAGKKFFDNSPCHRLTTEGIYVLQCGDPTGSGTGGPGYEFELENPPADGSYPAGTVAMARGPQTDSNGSQFFFVYDDSTIDPSGGGYSIFGRVTSGLPILKALAAGGTQDGSPDGAPKTPIHLKSVSVKAS